MSRFGNPWARSTYDIVREILDDDHTRERWFGISGNQSGNDWALNTLAPFVATSSTNDYGAEVKVLGTDDTPIFTDSKRFDINEIFILDSTEASVWKLRTVWGTGTRADAVAAEQFSEEVVMIDPTNPQQSAGMAVMVRIIPLVVGVDKVWIQGWNATNNATIDFLVGVHEYDF